MSYHEVMIILLFDCIASGLAFAQHKVCNQLDSVQYYIGADMEPEALILLSSCLAKQPDHQEALLLRARIYSNEKQYLKALTDYNKLIELDSENKEIYYSTGFVRYQLGQYQMALDDFYKCQQLPSKETSTAYFKVSPSDNRAIGISTIQNMDVDLYNFIGLCHFELQQYSQAIEAYNIGLEISPQEIDLLINRALCYQSTNKQTLAKTDFESVIRLDPDNEIASLNLLRLQSSTEKLDSFNHYIDAHSDQPEGYADRGLLFFESGNYVAAQRDFEQALILDPENQNYSFNLALTYIKLNKLNKAAGLLINLTDKDSRHAGAYFNLGNISYLQQEYEKAISYYNLAITYQPENADYLFNRGLTFYAMKKLGNACEDMQKVRAIDSDKADDFYMKFCIEN